MHVKFLAQLHQRLVALERRQGYLRLERRRMAPTWPSHFTAPIIGRLLYHQSRNLTYPLVLISAATSNGFAQVALGSPEERGQINVAAIFPSNLFACSV